MDGAESVLVSDSMVLAEAVVSQEVETRREAPARELVEQSFSRSVVQGCRWSGAGAKKLPLCAA
ncbi:hypothetical protein BH23ACT11_BH23ACT11_01610 [soil metagenome]